MIDVEPSDKDFRMLSEAVQQWFRFYEVSPDDRASSRLGSEALQLYNEGYRTAEEIATLLIGSYVGLWSTRIISASSSSVH